MPVPLLLAIVLAFGLRLPTDLRPLGMQATLLRLGEAAFGAMLVGVIAVVLGWRLAARIRRAGGVNGRIRRRLLWARRVVDGLAVATFAATLWLVDWVRVVDFGLGLERVPVVEELAILGPFLLASLLGIVGLHPAESQLRDGPPLGLRGRLWLRFRRGAGVVLPVLMLSIVSREVIRNDADELSFFALFGAAAVVFLISPLFVRIAWPARSLPKGALRDRLEHMARRMRFRASDILVWDTGGTVVNAAVTGPIPWLRYVLISDAMIDQLTIGEIEAVFGHEVGHIRHRHLPYFALFFLGSAAFITLAAAAAERFVDFDAPFDRLFPNSAFAEVFKAVLVIAVLGAYFFAAFGFLSRRFERQADVFGARSVSCGNDPCVAHVDPNLPSAPESPIQALCPSGIGLLASALADVAAINGMPRNSGSWRHGTIGDRIAFLLSLEGNPAAEGRFQARVRRLRWGVVLALGIGSVVAWGIAMLVPSAGGS